MGITLQAIKRLSCGKLSPDVNNLLLRKLDQQLENEIHNNLQRDLITMKEEINIIHKAVVQHHHIPANVRSKYDIFYD